MSSVRVKKHQYASFGPQGNPSARPFLAKLFTRSSLDANGTEPSETAEIDGQVVTRRRAGSKIQDHLLQTPLMGSNGRPRASSLLNHPAVTLEGSIADIQMKGAGGSGIIDAALSDEPEDHHDDIVEHLDVIDPQVATACNLTNAANAILIPPLSFIPLRKPSLLLSPPPVDTAREGLKSGRPIHEDSLDQHVDDVMRRRDKVRRTLKGVWSFLIGVIQITCANGYKLIRDSAWCMQLLFKQVVTTIDNTSPQIFTGIYGFLVVFWGAAIVFFLLKIINFHNANTQGFWVEVSSQVVNGLFTVTGIGLIPFRVLDTYRISRIYSYKRRTKELRRKSGLPQLLDEDDLPDPIYDPNYVHVLTEEEQKDLHRQQGKFHHSQTWYRPHGTETHRASSSIRSAVFKFRMKTQAFPIGFALLICCLNVGNSIFQAHLG
ncbi:hypothetical protein D9757_002701 [Collybiopsis confluens]|uniref:Uncharacterized protein n=1 Tax=Collybiopsis confluens TaxID=2823264 RepID=A0A8H5HWM3_9AGAR|nr:hypothetical protein D9757_002701 [Collybiopsis confluens]